MPGQARGVKCFSGFYADGIPSCLRSRSLTHKYENFLIKENEEKFLPWGCISEVAKSEERAHSLRRVGTRQQTDVATTQGVPITRALVVAAPLC